MFKHFKQFDNFQSYHNFLKTYDESAPLISLVLYEHDVYFDNKYRFVDLELPSGTLWARNNIGAKKETDSGIYFAWGDQNLSSENIWDFWQYDYIFYSGNSMIKYNNVDNLTQLRPIDDIVSLRIGQNWHMPTAEQFQELLNTSYCTNEWVTNYLDSGKNGILFTSVANNKTLFFPAAGNYIYQSYNNVLINENQQVSVWSSTLNTTDVNKALYFNVTSSSSQINSDMYRYYGLPIRGVYELID